MWKLFRSGWPALLACTVAPAQTSAAQQAEPELVLSVRVHLLTSEVVPELNSTLSEQDIRRIFVEVNDVWRQAGIRWEVESVVHEAAQAEDEFPDGEVDRSNRNRVRSIISRVCPEDQWLQGAWNVCVLRKFPIPAGGVYLPERRQVLWAELNPLGEMHPMVLAHELGHSLCLSHVQDSPRNLMRTGPATAWLRGEAPEAGLDPSVITELTVNQIAGARRRAAIGSPHGGAAQCRGGS